MKKLYHYLLIIIFVALFFSQITYAVTWQGKKENSGGVVHIKNPAEPVFGTMSLSVVEDLTLGFKDDDDNVFSWVSSVNVDSADNIYVLDSKSCTIFKFDKQGKLLTQFGRPGSGPGEFQRPRDFFVNATGETTIIDNNIIHYLDNTGKLKKQAKFTSEITQFVVCGNNRLYISFREYSPAGKFTKIDFISPDLTLRIPIQKYSEGKMVIRSEGDKNLTFNLEHYYSPVFVLTRQLNNSCIIADASTYLLNIYNETGKPVLKISKEENPKSITSEEKDAVYNQYAPYYEKKWGKNVLKEAIQYPEHRIFFSSILSDDVGRLYVFRVPSVLEAQKNPSLYTADVFSKDGYYLYRLNMKIKPNFIFRGYFYYIDDSDEDNGIVVKRLKVKDWNLLKSSL